MEDWLNGGFGLYVHWPFCVSKCPYCDFNSHVAGTIDETDWANAYLTAIDYYAELTPERSLSSIYFGGGTPSLMSPNLVAKIIARAQQKWHFSNDIEITLEANPNSVEIGKFQGFKNAGVNRVSLGVQALNETDLRRLGRMHSVAEALKALEIARKTFDRFSFDLIYARQDQSLEAWQAELTTALNLEPDHLAMYQLTVEPGTVFGNRHLAGKLKGLPDEDLSADMYDLTHNMCNINGLPYYEVSNHARPGFESKHNMIYWNAGDYIGIGPGAHGRITLPTGRVATETPLGPSPWLKQVKENGSGESQRDRLSATEQATEYLLMGLRTTQGLSLNRFEILGGVPLDFEKIAGLVDLNLLKNMDGRITATQQGMAVLNALIRELAPL